MENKIQNKYSFETAGGRMVADVPVCGPQEKVFEVKDNIFKKAQNLETLNYVYVLEKGKLVGVFSLKEIFKRKDDERAKDFMGTRIIKVNPHQGQEKVAFLAIKHNLKAIPVVDKDNIFLGVVPSDIILNILHKENIEDVFLSAGLYKKEELSSKILEAPAGLLAKIRLPWLVLGLFGGILAAQITIIFEAPLKSHFILAAFIPLIVYMADAVGSQTQTLYIKNLALNHFSQNKYFLKEIKTGLLMAFVLSILIVYKKAVLSEPLG